MRRSTKDGEDASEFLDNEDTFFADEKKWAPGDAATIQGQPQYSSSDGIAAAVAEYDSAAAGAGEASVGRVSLEELFAVVDGMGLEDAQRACAELEVVFEEEGESIEGQTLAQLQNAMRGHFAAAAAAEVPR